MIRWAFSAILAGCAQFFLDWVLPQDTARIWVITIAGIVALFWSKIDDAIRGVK